MADAEEAIEKIRRAYYEARRRQPPKYDPLPSWEALPLGWREMIIDLWHAGREDVLAAVGRK